MGSLAGEIGLDAFGIASADKFESTFRDLVERKAAGLSATMEFTYRNPSRSTDPAQIVPGARAIFVGALSYRRSAPATSGPIGSAQGQVARYSWRDNYAILRDKLEPIASALRKEGWKAKVVCDENALVDREAAYRAGIGWYGKNSMLLIPRKGSWFLLGSVITDAPLPTLDSRAADGCGSCSKCITACPTGAIISPGKVDARRCLAWLLQAPGDFPIEFREALGSRIYGCDECQIVCPPNRLADRRDPPMNAGQSEEPWVDLVWIILATDSELLERFGRWYIPARDPRYLRRNALVALGNTVAQGNTVALGNTVVANDPRALEAVETAMSSDDPMISSHALWAYEKFPLVKISVLPDKIKAKSSVLPDKKVKV